MTPICENPGCGNEFVARNPRRRFCSDECRFEAWDQQNPRVQRDDRTTVEMHPLDEVRAEHEETESKARWTAIVREHLNRTLLCTGYVSAEDFETLGIPDQHCNLANAQMGGYASAGYMEAITFKRWSTSQKPSRKSGKYWVYKLSEKGREKLSATSPAPATPAAEPEPDLATDLKQTEQRLFEGREPLPASSSSAFNPENEWA